MVVMEFCSAQELWMIVVERVGRWAWIVAAAAMVLVHKRLRRISLGLSRSSDGALSVELKAPPPSSACCESKEDLDAAIPDSFAAGRDFAEDFPVAARPAREWSPLERLGEGNFVCKGVELDRAAEWPWEEGEDEGASWSFKVPEWANSLLQPLMPSEEDWYRQSGKEWDALRGELDPEWKRAVKSMLGDHRGKARTIVAKGPHYLAKAKNEVVKLWGSSKQKILENWYLPEEQGFVTALGVSDGHFLDAVAAGSSDGYLSIWDVATGECARSFSASKLSIQGVAMGAGIGGGLGGIYCSPAAVAFWDARSMKKGVDCFDSFAVDSLSAAHDHARFAGIESIGAHEFVVRGVRGEEAAFDVRMAARSSRGLPLPAAHREEEEEEEVWWDAIQDQEGLEEEEEDSDGDEEIEAHVSSSSGKGFFSKCVALFTPV
ncbi:hypothetical protein SELMODRAFT_449308 [Selaginella moellendorffii]|uniref:Uncharacterized protein n=1 Tax=Selaginella moellendorffii TaxID=88036 RepID=D8TEW7_SELML|nr:hypothetical protein SELMODRAFT_449308 [Selaginella moellendorffii]